MRSFHVPTRVVPLVLALLAAAAVHGAAVAKSVRPVPSATGSHHYALTLLRRGTRDSIPDSEARRLQAGHLGNIRRMFELGALDAAGPFGDDTPLRGLFLFRSDTLALDSLFAPDPLIGAGRLRVETHTWITREGVGDAYRARGVASPGARDSMVTFSFVLLKRGPAWSAVATPELTRLLERQQRELAAWSASGRLRLAGPIAGTGELRGVYVFDADTATTARLLARDPLVRAGRIVFEIHPWWTAHGVVPGP